MIPPPHPLFRAFDEFDGLAAPGFETSYFGAQFRDWLFTGHPRALPRAAAFTWVIRRLPRSTSSGSPCWARWLRQGPVLHVGIGAGWGRWSVYAAMLCRQRRLPFTLVAVEPEPSHFQWLQMVFQDNGIDPREHHLYEARWSPAARWRDWPASTIRSMSTDTM